MESALLYVENLISGMLPFALLIICGIFLSVKGRFFQFTRFFESVRLVIKAFRTKNKGEGVSSFQAACTALSATVGTGNIAGVAGAISLGGAGAIFWMWISALCGMAIKFVEVGFAVVYRERSGNEYVGGPMYYIKNGLPAAFKPLAYIFAAVAIPSVFCSGNITQTNAAVTSIVSSEKARLVVGVIFAILIFSVVVGGSRRIGIVSEKLVPFMSLAYIILSFAIIAANPERLTIAFKMIIEGAFSPKAVTGGVIGSASTAIMVGASRGIFSNEAGLGTSAMAHSVAEDAKPETQGLFGIFEVFVDTILICTLTALTILCSGVNIEYGRVAGTELVQKAMLGVFGEMSGYLLGAMMCVFGFSSVIGWAVYGKLCSGYIFGDRGVRIFTMLYPLGCIVGAVSSSQFAWRMSAFLNGIMLCINTAAILLSQNELFEKENKNAKTKNRENKRDIGRGQCGTCYE